MPTGIFNIDDCAKGCNENSECSAFAIYHEDKKCYFFKPKDVAYDTGDLKDQGVCFIKDTRRKGVTMGLAPGVVLTRREETVASALLLSQDKLVVEEDENGEPKMSVYVNGASKMIMSISIAATGLVLLAQ